MRLFIAITFNDEVKEKISHIIEALRMRSTKGNFTLVDNLHLTLVFLGQLDESKIRVVEQGLNRIDLPPFIMVLENLGKFHRPGGDIYWIGVEGNHDLTQLYGKIVSLLQDRGFTIENRPYQPHVTLGRKVLLNNYENTIEPIQVKADKICLMESKQVNGKLTYIEVYHKVLHESKNE
ncbi:MAG: RNA 2',3'-cyclic phosphodiesterase [Eubacteriales bacterium]